jgi:hypothetical protein
MTHRLCSFLEVAGKQGGDWVGPCVPLGHRCVSVARTDGTHLHLHFLLSAKGLRAKEGGDTLPEMK